MNTNVQKLFTAITIGSLLFQTSVTPMLAFAEDTPTPPSNPEAPVAPTSAPQAPTSAPTAPQSPTTSPSASNSQVSPTPSATNTLTPTPTPKKEYIGPKEEGDPNRTLSTSSAAAVGVNPTPTPTVSPTIPSSPGGVGTSDIKTGDASNGASIMTGANSNSLQSGQGANGGATVANGGNGTDSSNNGSAIVANNATTNQNNTAVINSDLSGATVTGKNVSSDNVGDASIKSGNANTSGTIITTANTNVDGIMVSEFNVVDDHQGDYVLDFGANCILGCGTPATVFNKGNGSGSDNAAVIDESTNDATFQNNDAAIGNTLVLAADSGNNMASRNTGGDSNITTGNANVAANALTFANNNFSGNVIYGTVNIYGDLIGDIILTEEELAKYGINTTAANTGNGSGSTNTSAVEQANSNTTFQNNDANILNTIVYDAQTGTNDASANTDGDTSITTGDTNVTANVLNIANSNIAGGNMWLVLINRAGQWFGKLVGAPEGSQFAGSEGVEFTVGENGEITASNNGNGSGSTNNATVSDQNTTTTGQNNNAAIENKLDLSANTGGNKTSDNTGGNSAIKTGDANIIANLVNFVNNNVSGNGKLFVTVVNVFGTWMGDFLTPGQRKEAKNTTSNSNSNNTTSSNQNSTPSVATTTNTTKTVDTKTATGGVISSAAKFFGVTTTKKKVLAAATDGATVEPSNQPTPMVKGSHYDKSQTQVMNSKVRINLAWLVVLLPLAGLIFLMKKISTNILLRK